MTNPAEAVPLLFALVAACALWVIFAILVHLQSAQDVLDGAADLVAADPLVYDLEWAGGTIHARDGLTPDQVARYRLYFPELHNVLDVAL